jgi:hypothetical protein
MRMLKSWKEMCELDISKYVKQRDKVDYLPWSSCLKLLYDNGAGKVTITTLTTENGSSLFMAGKTFADKNSATNCCYEVRVKVDIDGNEYAISYPIMNGIHPVHDKLMNQNAVHKAQMRAFVKCVAINTGLGFNLWLDDSDIDDGAEDLSKHNIYAIRERMQQQYTRLVKRGLSTSEIAKMMNTSEQTVQYYLNGIFDEINRFEKALGAL